MDKIQYFENILDLVGSTPLVSLEKIVSAMQGRFFAKVEAFNPGHSAKDRTALHIIKDAEAKGLLTPGGVIVETTSGNTLLTHLSHHAPSHQQLLSMLPEGLQPGYDCRYPWLPLYLGRNR